MLFLLYHHLDNHEETRQHKNVKSHGRRSLEGQVQEQQFIGMHIFRDWHLSQKDFDVDSDIIQAQLRAAFLCFNHP